MCYKVSFNMLSLNRDLAEFEGGSEIDRPTTTLDCTHKNEARAADIKV